LAKLQIDHLIDHAPVGIVVLDRHGVVAKANPAFLRIFGLTDARDMIGSINFLEAGEARSPGVARYFVRAYRGEVVQVPVVSVYTQAGAARSVRGTLIPAKDSAGEVEALVCMLEDITDLAATERDLAHRYNHTLDLQKAFQQIAAETDVAGVMQRIVAGLSRMWEDPCALWMFDGADHVWTCAASRGLPVSYISAVQAHYSRLEAERTVGGLVVLRNAPVMVEDFDSNPLTAPIRDAAREAGVRRMLAVPLRSGNAISGVLALYGTQSGPFDPADVDTAILLSAQAAVALHNAQLFTEMESIRRNLEDRVDERTAALNAAHADAVANERLAAVGFMAREVAHGLRNPLNVISASNYYIRSRFRDPDEKVLRHLDTVDRYVEQAANIINQLMNLAGSRQLDMQPVDINQLVQRALQERIASEGPDFEAKWLPDPLMVAGDWLQLSHIVKALVTNAASAEGHGQILVQTYIEDGQAVFAVGDHRPATSNAERSDRFDAFVASATQWTGLGLSVARQIARKHGGDVADDASGGVTWFRLTLPLLETAE
jgi:PAS domain S-box-containing protein